MMIHYKACVLILICYECLKWNFDIPRISNETKLNLESKNFTIYMISPSEVPLISFDTMEEIQDNYNA